MVYASVCSGVEAASLAWQPFGWKAAWLSEINPHACRFLSAKYPKVPNLGDMTKLNDHEIYRQSAIDLLVGGTPCQSFSIAGLRGGLDDERGNLALEFCRILLHKKPRWFVWENVPGVFSSYSSSESEDFGKNGIYTVRGSIREVIETADFGSILDGFRECGYSCAYRVLDSQYFGVPQRRRRVFVVGYLGNDWRPSAAVLFESESLRRDLAPRREKGQEVAGTLEARTRGGGFPGTDGAASGHITCMTGEVTNPLTKASSVTEDGRGRGLPIVACLDANYGRLQGASGQDLNHGHSHLVTQPINSVMATGQANADVVHGQARGLTVNHEAPILFSIMPQNSGKDYKARPVEIAQPLMAGGPVSGNQGGDFVCQPVIFTQNTRDEVRFLGGDGQIVGALGASHGTKQQPYLQQQDVVRRLTPLECERLQGFPDGYTDVAGLSVSARYALIGNSMTRQVMAWIGQRIQKVDEILSK